MEFDDIVPYMANETQDMRNISDNATQICQHSFDMPMFLHLSLIPAVLIIGCLSFLQKRKNLLNCCNGRPGLVVPVNFLDGFRDRWSYAAAFGATTMSVTALFYGSISSYMNVDIPLWTKAILTFVVIMEVCLNYYPLFVCISTPFTLIGSIFGFLYASMWLTIQLIHVLECSQPDQHTDGSVFNVALNIPYSALLLQWPAFVCLIYLVAKFFHSLITCVMTKQCKTQELSDEIISPHQIQYVKDLFIHSPVIKTRSSGASLIERYKYRSLRGFRYPTRVLITFTVTLFLLYQVTWGYCYLGSTMLTELIDLARAMETSELRDVFLSIFTVVEAWWYIVTILTLILLVLYLYIIMRNYRLHILKLQRGDKSFLPARRFYSHSLMADSMRWGGYQVAYMGWGFVVSHLSLFIFGLVLIMVIYLPIAFNAANILLNVFQILVVPLSLNILVYYAQTLWARLAFLQPKINREDKQPPLAVDNRNAFEIATYYSFMANITMGIISSLFRLLLSLVLGIMMLGRIDRSVLMTDYEYWDRGFQAYIGMICVDYTHNHPVLRVFCKILMDKKVPRKHASPYTTSLDSALGDCATNEMDNSATHSCESDRQSHDENCGRYGSCNSPAAAPTSHRRETEINKAVVDSAARRRWFLAYSLINNPVLIQHRRGPASKEKQNIISAMHSYRQHLMIRHINEGHHPHRFYRLSSSDSILTPLSALDENPENNIFFCAGDADIENGRRKNNTDDDDVLLLI